MLCKGLTRKQANDLYLEVLEANDNKALRRLAQEDLFFLLTVACKRKDIDKDWLYDRCREVESEPNGYLDLWAREHYKSTLITFGHSIKDILTDPNVTIGLFSHTRPNSKAFLEQIKRELESNSFLKSLFPDILYDNPKAEAPKWSLDSGIIVKRSQNPKEATVEAWGLVEGQPTGRHFEIQVYDDVVTMESVTTSEQIFKINSAWEMSLNLGAKGGRIRYIGTRYHANDTYRLMMDRGSVKPRVYPATHNGKIDGDPVFLTNEELMKKRRDMGPYTFGSQMLQDPVADKAMGFHNDWLKYYKTKPETNGWNIYILVDPASKKKKTSDFTVVEVIGLAPDNNYYLLDAIRDRLNLTQRCSTLFHLHRKWTPIAVGYEEYGLQADAEHIEYVMEQENYRFNIIRLGGQVHKDDRIKGLIPIYEQKRFYMPEMLRFTNYEGESVDYIKVFVTQEYETFPVATHDDMLDCRARILDPMLGAKFPKIAKPQPKQPAVYRGSTGWMS